MIKPIVEYILKKKSRDAEKPFSLVHGDLIMRMAVITIYSEDQSFNHVMNYVNELRKRGKKTVDFYIFFPSKKAMINFTPSSKDIVFSSSDFNLLGKFKSPTLIDNLKKDYEVLIDLSRGKSLACDVVISKLAAKWKAGEHDAKRTYLLDFMIDLKNDNDVQKLIYHLDHYLSNFNNSNAA